MKWGFRGNSLSLAALIVLTLSASTSCRTTEKDVERWANTEQGPRKLVAVLKHEKYGTELRVDAAMTLVSMKPRGGRRVGIERLHSALVDMPPGERKRIVAQLVPGLIQHLQKPPPAGKADDSTDSTIPYKDAAFELLTSEGTVLIEDPEQRQALRAALVAWAMADFSGRMDAPSQKVGMEQLMRELGPAGVRGLPELIKPEAPKVDRIAQLVAEVGDAETKERASARLVAVAREVASKAWLDRKAPLLKKANEESGIKVDDARFNLQLARFQEEELLRSFSSMKRVGGRASVEFLLGFAADTTRPEKQRAGALAAMEGQMDKREKGQLEKVLALASSDATPDLVRDLALRRVGEMPRVQVIEPLYQLFNNDNWKVRWAAAELVLKMSESKHLAEFMAKVANVKHMSLSEPLRYGKLIGELKGEPSPQSLVNSYANDSHEVPVRITALGYYYSFGDATDVAKLSRFYKDSSELPSCAKNAKDCEWKCADREVTTIGEFVTNCIKPALEARKPATAPAKAATNAKASQEPVKKK